MNFLNLARPPMTPPPPWKGQFRFPPPRGGKQSSDAIVGTRLNGYLGHVQGAPAEQGKAGDHSVSGYRLREANAALRKLPPLQMAMYFMDDA
jgi:hypothetical protein